MGLPLRSPRLYPNAQIVHGIRLMWAPGSGGVVLKPGVLTPIGCMPAGAFALHAGVHVQTVAGVALTLDVGTLAAPTAFVVAADLNTLSMGYAVGTGFGWQGADDVQVYARLNGVLTPAAGARTDIVLMFYGNKD
jgi:hypothetical protein